MSDAPSKSIIGEKLALLEEAIREVETAIRERKDIAAAHLKQIDAEMKEVQYFLGFLPDPWREGFIPAMESIRITLHKNLTSRRVNRRKEELSQWSDLLSLLRERRELVMEQRALLAATRKT